MAYQLVTTEHLEDRLLFRNFQDYVVAMNYVALQAFKCGVFVLAFVLMSNHMHFVLLCSKERAKAFINGFKTAYSRYLWRKYGCREHLRRLKVEIRAVRGEEAVEWAVAYVQMNPVAANICASPFEYPWGTGNTFFKATTGEGDGGIAGGVTLPAGGRRVGGSASEQGQPQVVMLERSRPVKELSERKRFKILHSREDVPGSWRIGDAGYVLPESYVRKDIVESTYRTPRRMLYFLKNSSKAKQRLAMTDANIPAFRDQVILAAVPDLCQSLFRKRSVDELSEEQLVELLRQLRYRFSASAHQLARVTGLTYETAAKYLDRA